MNLYNYKIICVKQLQTQFIKITYSIKVFYKDKCTNHINKDKLKFKIFGRII